MLIRINVIKTSSMSKIDIVELYKKSNQFGKELELEYEFMEHGGTINKLHISQKHLATPTHAHGGVIAALADSTLGVAALAIAQKQGNLVSTVELKINFMKPVALGDTITGSPRVRQAGKRIIFVDGEFTNQKGELIGTASGTFNQYPFTKVFNF